MGINGVARTIQKDIIEMKGICNSCVHKIECRDYAIADPNIFGIWGGTTYEERRELRASRRALTR